MKILQMIEINKQLFVATEDGVYRLYDGKLVKVPFKG